jgi:hypothetical protein
LLDRFDLGLEVGWFLPSGFASILAGRAVLGRLRNLLDAPWPTTLPALTDLR